MRLSWRERLVQQPRLWTYTNWPQIPLVSVPRKRRQQFVRNQTMIAQVLNHTPLGDVAQQHNVSPGRVSQLLDRCLGGEDDAPPPLTQALIPYRVVVDKQRKQPLPTLQNKQGVACAFKALLTTVPGLLDGLVDMVEAKLKDTNYAQAPTPEAFHGEIKRRLTEAHWPTDTYPFTDNSQAYQSARRLLHQITMELQQAHQANKTPPARNLGLAHKRFRALRAIQIDEHTVDLSNRVNLELNDELIPLRLARASVLVAVDVDTTCVLGYYMAPTRHPNQVDMLTLVDNCISPWQPLALATPGLSYEPGAVFPSGLREPFPINFGTVNLDNALLHRAQSVIDLLCDKMGATLGQGLPAMPEIRELVESVFDYINKKCSHRFPSTTGSYPTDPKKESRKNQKRPPVITYQTVEEALSVILTEYNITPKASLGGATPLELFQYQCQTHFVRYTPGMLASQWQPFIGSKEVPLKWYRDEKRQPHINYMYQRYDGPGLIRIAGKAKRIRVQYDNRDLRTLHAFSLDGEDLGQLQVRSPWRRFPHTLATRRFIHENTKALRLNMRDPLSSLFHHLLVNKGKPKKALSLLRVYTEFTGGLGGPLLLGDPDESTPSTISTSKERRFTWDPTNANHQE